MGDTFELEGIVTFIAAQLLREPWRVDAACRAHPRPGIFFEQPRPGRPRKDAPEPEAPKVCAACPVRDECQALAESLDLVSGWWGGVRYRYGKPQQ